MSPSSASSDLQFSALQERLHALARKEIAPHADAVDRDARFPEETFALLRRERLLSAYVPGEFGGMGLSLTQIARLCELLGQYDANAAMIYAMHQIQVANLVHHATHQPFFQRYLRELAAGQLLLGSATTEAGIGGDIRNSRCAVEVDGDRFRLEKNAPVISYGEQSDAILVTCRRHADAPSHDQLDVLVRRQDYTLEFTQGWDTLGFRGTCSLGYILRAEAAIEQILPLPYAEIHRRTMAPCAHILWTSLWLGLATDAVIKARATVRADARKTPGVLPISATRLAELEILLNQLRSTVHDTTAEYQRQLDTRDDESAGSVAFLLRINQLKLTASQMIVDIVGRAMLIVGIGSYRNDSPQSLCRHLRDAHGAALMVNNDRILGHNASLQIGLR